MGKLDVLVCRGKAVMFSIKLEDRRCRLMNLKAALTLATVYSFSC